jgi:hypothetical protein
MAILCTGAAIVLVRQMLLEEVATKDLRGAETWAAEMTRPKTLDHIYILYVKVDKRY